MAKYYAFNNLAGCVTQRRNRLTGTIVGLYHAAQAGIENDPIEKWATVCEEHHTLVLHPTLALAKSHMAVPFWCEYCQAKIFSRRDSNV